MNKTECARLSLARKRSCSIDSRFVLPGREAATLVRVLTRQEWAPDRRKIALFEHARPAEN